MPIIDYSKEISRGSGTFETIKLLFRWKGSAYKLMWRDLVIFFLSYYILNFTYRFVLNDDHQQIFKQVVLFFKKRQENIPISFLLGFFVSGVLSRWYTMFYNIPWINKIAFLLQNHINGKPLSEALRVRMTIARYCNLAWIFLMYKISDQIVHRLGGKKVASLPIQTLCKNINEQDIVKSTFGKLITQREMEACERYLKQKKTIINAKQTKKKDIHSNVPDFWLPLEWSTRLIQHAFYQGLISDPRTQNVLIDEVEDLRQKMHLIRTYNFIVMPLVYTQVVTISVYTYFICLLIGSQFVEPEPDKNEFLVDMYVPVITFCIFLFLNGWFKVAICVMNPFGDDDEDFPTNFLLDFNVRVTYLTIIAHDDFYPEGIVRPDFKFRMDFRSEKDQDQLKDIINGIEDDNQKPEINYGQSKDNVAISLGEAECSDVMMDGSNVAFLTKRPDSNDP